MPGESEFNTFGRTGKLLIIEAFRKRGYAYCGISETWIEGRHGRELYVDINGWTPTVIVVDYDNVALWDELNARVKAFKAQVAKEYAKAEDLLIAKFDELVAKQEES